MDFSLLLPNRGDGRQKEFNPRYNQPKWPKENMDLMFLMEPFENMMEMTSLMLSAS